MPAASLADRLRARIAAEGPISVADYVDAALYDPDGGFYTSPRDDGPGRAGRRGDFLTAPEVGPLFGAVIARALDAWWAELGRAEPFVVHEWGAGPGTLARTVLAAAPEVLTGGALRWCAIERSAAQLATHPGHPAVGSGPTLTEARAAVGLDAEPGVGVVLANELLDNLPFEIHEHHPLGWREQRVGLGTEGQFALVAEQPTSRPDPTRDAFLAGLLEVGLTGHAVPWQPAARAWLGQAMGSLSAGRVVVLDYGGPTAALVARGGWLRTHRLHDDSLEWLEAPGSCDITVDVATDQLQLEHPAEHDRTQGEFLRAHGIDALVEEGRAAWAASAGVGDLAALTARSRVREAEALLDPAGMGSFRVLEWPIGGN